MLSEINQPQRNTVWFDLHEVSRVVKFLKTESRRVVARAGKEGRMKSGILNAWCKEFWRWNVGLVD